MFTLSSIIFKLFGSDEKLNDVNKDIDGKGTLERYNLAMAEDFDENSLVKLNDLVVNTKDPFTLENKFLAYIENDLGLENDFLITDDERRQIISISNRLFDIRGTIFSYKLMLKWLGISEVYIIEHEDFYSFDSPLTFDSPIRRFDNTDFCGCREYSIQLVGDVELDNSLIQKIFNIVKFNEPIDADLRAITYNGFNISNKVLKVYISDGTDGYNEGDLIYDNELAPNVTLRLATIEDEPEYTVGDLIIDGEDSSKYTLSSNGDLIFVDGAFYFNNALKLNGVDEFVTISDDVSLQLVNDSISISLWFNLSDVSGTNPLVNKISATVGYDLSVIDGKVVLLVKNATGQNKIESNITVVTNQWYNVTVTVLDETIGSYNLYVNGETDAYSVITSTLTSSNINNSDDVLIGTNGIDFTSGKLDTLVITETVISSIKAKGIYNFGDGQDISIFAIDNIIVLLNFDEVNGLTIFDISGFNNNGTLTGVGDNSNHILHG